MNTEKLTLSIALLLLSASAANAAGGAGGSGGSSGSAGSSGSGGTSVGSSANANGDSRSGSATSNSDTTTNGSRTKSADVASGRTTANGNSAGVTGNTTGSTGVDARTDTTRLTGHGHSTTHPQAPSGSKPGANALGTDQNRSTDLNGNAPGDVNNSPAHSGIGGATNPNGFDNRDDGSGTTSNLNNRPER